MNSFSQIQQRLSPDPEPVFTAGRFCFTTLFRTLFLTCSVHFSCNNALISASSSPPNSLVALEANSANI